MKDNSQSPLVATQLSPFCSVLERFRAEETAKDPDSSSQLPDLNSVQCAASSQAKIQNCLKDTGTASKLASTGANGGQPSEYKQEIRIVFGSILRTLNLFIFRPKMPSVHNETMLGF